MVVTQRVMVVTERVFQSRPMALGSRGAASTPHLLASQAAIDALRAGGNAVDAAVAAASVATVVQPFSSSVGGVGWAAVYDAGARTTEVLHFVGAVPRALDPSAFRPDPTGLVDWRHLEQVGSPLLGCLTPGVAAGWEELLARKGSWPLARVLEPAIALAKEGFPVSELLATNMALSAARLRRWPESARIFLRGGEPFKVGERLVQSDLGTTLQRIARNGSAEMVTGDSGRAIVELHRSGGGALGGGDLDENRPTWHPALTAGYRDLVVHAAPAPLGDVSFLSGIQLLDAFPPFSGPLDPDYVHTSIESAKLVASDRARFLGDGVDAAIVERLLGARHLDELRSRISPQARAGRTSGRVAEDTITLATVDERGNAVHLMQTVGTLFGTGAVAAGTGVLLNSSLYFAFARGAEANRIVPGGHLEQNPCIAVVLDAAGRLRLVAGSPGGRTRVETVRQLLANVVDFGMNVQQAVDAGRFLNSPDGTSVDFEARYGRRVHLTSEFLEPVLTALLGRVHRQVGVTE